MGPGCWGSLLERYLGHRSASNSKHVQNRLVGLERVLDCCERERERGRERERERERERTREGPGDSHVDQLNPTLTML